MPKVPYPYEVNGKLVTGNGSLIPICSLQNCSLLSSLTIVNNNVTAVVELCQNTNQKVICKYAKNKKSQRKGWVSKFF